MCGDFGQLASFAHLRPCVHTLMYSYIYALIHPYRYKHHRSNNHHTTRLFLYFFVVFLSAYSLLNISLSHAYVSIHFSLDSLTLCLYAMCFICSRSYLWAQTYESISLQARIFIYSFIAYYLLF